MTQVIAQRNRDSHELYIANCSISILQIGPNWFSSSVKLLRNSEQTDFKKFQQ